MLLWCAMLLGGFFVLYLGAVWLVGGARAIAEALHIPQAVVGLTLVAIGTSAPELFVNVIAGYNGNTELALSNVSGSNLTNIGVGFGLCALLAGFEIKRRAFRADLIMLVVSAATVTGILALNPSSPMMPLWAIAPLVLLLIIYLSSLRGRTGPDMVTHKGERKTHWGGLTLEFGRLAVGIAGLYAGGQLVLNGATSIAEHFEIPHDDHRADNRRGRHVDTRCDRLAGRRAFARLWHRGRQSSRQ